jgi:HK97 family phage portal protein
VSLFRQARHKRALGDTLQELVAGRSATAARVQDITPDTALRHSAVWACLRLRADLISTLPLCVYRQVAGLDIEVSKPALLEQPFTDIDITEWLYSSQVELDRTGNAFGVIRARDGYGFPAQVELVATSDVVVRATGSVVTEYRIGNHRFKPDEVWHERQFTVAGLPIGLSPIAYAAWTIGSYEAAQQFAMDLFVTGAFPSGVLRNTEVKAMPKNVIAEAKAQFKHAVERRDIFVTGADWEWKPAAVEQVANGFLDTMKYGVSDVCRFLGVPGDAIDAEHHGKSITYANVTQRNLQLLVHNLGPAIHRRERRLSRAIPSNRRVRFDTDALLRMDPQTREEVILRRVAAKVLTADEARAMDNLPPLTPAQIEQMQTIALPAPEANTIKEKPANG